MPLVLVIVPNVDIPSVREVLSAADLLSQSRFVTTWQTGLAALRERLWDIVVVFCTLVFPESFVSIRTFFDLAHGAPVVVVVGRIGEEATAQLVRQGAADVVSQSNIGRLPDVIRRTSWVKSTGQLVEYSPIAQEWLASIVKHAPSGIVIHDELFNVVLCNETACRMLDLMEDELLGRTPLDPRWNVIRDDGRPYPGIEHPASVAIQTKTAVSGAVMGVPRPKRGDHVWLRVDAVPVLDVEGRLKFVVVNFTDITEQRRMQADLRVSEERFRTTLEGTLDAIYWLESQRDEHGNIVDFEFVEMNKRAEFELSMNRAELLGRTICEVFPINRAGGFFEQYRRVAETRQIFEQEYFIPPGNPADGYYHHTVLPVRDGVAIFNRNITERRRAELQLVDSEKRFRTAFEHSGTGMLLVSIEATILQANATACRILGHSSESIVGRHVDEMTHPDDLEQSRDVVRALLSKNLKSTSLEKRYVRPDGTIVWASIALETVPDNDGNVSYFVVVIHDITARKVAEAEKEQLQAQLLQSQKMEALGILAGGVAHDFNNILAAILCNVDFLSYDLQRIPQSAELLEVVTELHTAAQRGADLVRQILTFSRRGSLRRVVVALASIVKETLNFLRKTVPHNIEIHLDVRDGAVVMADATQMQQIVANICSNAIHAMEGSGGILTVVLEETVVNTELARKTAGLKEGVHAHLRIADTGIGMAENTLKHIFDPFFTTKGTGKGTGLGLAVVHGIVTAHEGAIGVQSVLGQGTSVDVWLPAVTDASIVVSQQESSLPRGRGERIIVVDDENGLARIIARLLDELGYNVVWMQNSTAAMTAFGQAPSGFHLALVDLHMPAPDGLELAKRFHDLRPDMPIVIMSGYRDALENTSLEPLGVVSVIQKPIGFEKLASEVRLVLDGGKPRLVEPLASA